MNEKVEHTIAAARRWLSVDVFPLWTARGIDPKNGGFEEALSDSGEPTNSDRRALVQARQIYSYTEALKMKILSEAEVQPIIQKSIQFLLQFYSQPNGSFIHAVSPQGEAKQKQNELYTQAFVIFCLARAYEILKSDDLKHTAKKLMTYLNSERKNPSGGYTEIKNGKLEYQSNPHMHLFEALLEWVRVSNDPEWTQWSHDVYNLCVHKFIQKDTGAIAEFFDENWNVLKENGKYLFEPGHQYEWAWLMKQYQKLTGSAVGDTPYKLFLLAEKYGVHPESGFVFDEVWSDYSVKKSSSRFWPQCERIKACVELGYDPAVQNKSFYAAAADQGMYVLKMYFTKPHPGLWHDTRLENGDFTVQAAKSSSLYHIINAISEYEIKRPLIS